MQHWLQALPANSTVVAPAGACYLINGGIVLTGVQGLTIAGGTWNDMTAPVAGASPTAMSAAIWFQGGSNVTLENMTVNGSSPGGYVPAGAFGGGIRSDGVIGFRVTDVNIDNVWGDGLELAPLRAANDLSSTILNPSENVFVYGLTVNGAGRQGISLVDVNGASLTDIVLKHIGINFFDVEADQWNEGALNVTINDCETGGVGDLFFANGGASSGAAYTGNITVENCTMDAPTAGEAVLVQPPSLQPHPRGPIVFSHDTLLCGASVYVSCVESDDANITVESSNVVCPTSTIHEPVYSADEDTGLTFMSDDVSGYTTPGTTDSSSHVSIDGGVWAPYVPPRTTTGPVKAGTSGTTGTTGGSSLAAGGLSTTPTTTKPVTPTTTGPAPTAHALGAPASAGGPTTATVLASNRTDPLTKPVMRAGMALDLFAGVVALGLLLVRRRRRSVPVNVSVSDLLTAPPIDTRSWND